MNSNDIRESFLHFFEEKGHRRMPSSSLVPRGDPTLLLTTAGMVQFKPYFTGEAVPPSPRLTSCQKCFRTTDIDSVGDTQHLTFFEMLGNFSIGNYFKKEAVEWAWEYVTERLKLDPDRLWVTIFTDDDEAFDCWRRIGFPEGKIKRFGEKHNFWGPAGDTGPCGPCSEIHYDLGGKIGCGRPECGPNCECGRFTEIWNLVFTQYDQQVDGSRLPLPRPNIDTGMGLERTAAAMQGVTTVYETDRFAPLIAGVARLSGKRYGEDEATDKAIRVVAEHSRAITFLIADGVMPSNEGRGYVLRRVLRRAAVFGRKLGMEGFIAELARIVIDQMKTAYPELKREQEFILSTIVAEEGRFEQTLDRGLGILEGLIKYRIRHRDAIADLIGFSCEHHPIADNASAILEKCGFVGYESESEPFEQIGEQAASESIVNLYSHILEDQEERTLEETTSSFDELRRWCLCLSGSEVFGLYDTYGFPRELTAEIAAERGFDIDCQGFEQQMSCQQERARSAKRSGTPAGNAVKIYARCGLPQTDFVGEDCRRLKCRSDVLMLASNGEKKDRLIEGDEGEVVLRRTPFYGEMGGQVGDAGELFGDRGRFAVENTMRPSPELMLHRGRVTRGQIATGDTVTACVDRERRLDIARNHTATHLLQAALRRVMGEHVRQSGSLVSPDYLRFDFSHPKSLTAEELSQIQGQVNEWIRQNIRVVPRITSYKEAVEKGALAFFDEKYGDEVRALVIGGRRPVSTELCGGTHVRSTGEIGYLYIVSEGSIGSGLRRIEAVTGRGAEAYIDKQLSILAEVAAELKAEPSQIRNRLSALRGEMDGQRKRIHALEHKSTRDDVESLVGKVVDVNGIAVLAAQVPSSDIEALRRTGDIIRDRLSSVLVVLGTVSNGQAAFVAMATPDLVKRGIHAGDIVRQVSQAAGGRGGGRPEMGQGGGRDVDRIDEALKLVREMVAKHGNAGN